MTMPRGGALAVDRDVFAKHITEKIKNHPRVTVFNEEVTEINPDEYTIIATGPLTSDGLADEMRKLQVRTNCTFMTQPHRL